MKYGKALSNLSALFRKFGHAGRLHRIGRAGIPAGRGPTTGTEAGPTAKGVRLLVPDQSE
jgi:hypothetical protein